MDYVEIAKVIVRGVLLIVFAYTLVQCNEVIWAWTASISDYRWIPICVWTIVVLAGYHSADDFIMRIDSNRRG